MTDDSDAGLVSDTDPERHAEPVYAEATTSVGTAPVESVPQMPPPGLDAEQEREREAEEVRRREAADAEAMLARLRALDANTKPEVLDEPNVIRMRVGPALRAELVEAGFGDAPVYVTEDRVQIALDVPARTKEEILAVLAAHDPTKPAPKPHAVKVSAAQAKIALYDHGFLDEAEAIVAAHPYAPVRIWWASANDWEMSNPYVPAIGAELGLGDDDLQELFDYAATR